jgi:hypothetical protein
MTGFKVLLGPNSTEPRARAQAWDVVELPVDAEHVLAMRQYVFS